MPLTEKQKYELVILHEQKYTNPLIAEKMSINIKTVVKWINKYNTDKNVNRSIGSGRKKNNN